MYGKCDSLGCSTSLRPVPTPTSENRTLAFLGVLARLLDAHGVMYRIEIRSAEAKADKSGGRRIIELAQLRNEVMQPLYDSSAAASAGVECFKHVLFLNDIIFCAADILEVSTHPTTPRSLSDTSVDRSSK
ncbi:hypothetical protein HWV62_4465 [Athelia sp. TMB]|nr:hypothetical protein HWV62_4465 [Athelia sp. TMB]